MYYFDFSQNQFVKSAKTSGASIADWGEKPTRPRPIALSGMVRRSDRAYCTMSEIFSVLFYF
jgi:hypothetical protein